MMTGAPSAIAKFEPQCDTLTMLDANFLFASLVWGSVGFGYFIYGKKQGSWVPLSGGLLMLVASYFISSAVLMSLLCIGLIAAVHLLLKLGY